MPRHDGLVPPPLIGAERQKKVYPPIQWRPLRVMNPWHKFGFLVGLVVANAAVSRLLGLALPVEAVVIITEPLWLIALVTVARSFRGWGEPVEPPRAWWRLTSRPRAGWLLGAMYLLGALSVFSPSKHAVVTWTDTVGSLLLAAAFLNSSIRLTVQRRRGR